MTTIKIKNASKFTKTQFEDIEELTEYLYNLFLEEELPALTISEIEQAEKAKEDLKNNPQTFKRSTER